MAIRLTETDRAGIWDIVIQAADEKGGHARLFDRPLEFEDDNGRIRFNWPDWMHDVRAFIVARYGEKDAQGLLLEVFTDVMSRDRFEERRRQMQPTSTPSGVTVWR